LVSASPALAILPPGCRNVVAAIEPFDVVQDATIISATLRTIITYEIHGEGPYLDSARTNQVMRAAKRFSAYLIEREAAGEAVPPNLRNRIDRLAMYVPMTEGQSLQRNEFEALSEDIHDWFQLRRNSRSPNALGLSR